MAARNDSLDSEEFVRLSLTDSTYAKVIFNDVKDFYLANEDVNCAFTMMSSIEPMAGDKVALYKVGWSCADDYIIAQPCQIEKCHSTMDMSVTFAGSTLPKDDGEYYQFCYITANDEIRGGSTPFVFKNSPVEDLFSEEDIENDLLLIQTRTSILEGSLQKAIKEKTSIQIEKQRLEKDFDSQKATLLNFESMTKDQDEKIRELELKLAESKTDAATNENMLKEEISQLNHFINGMKVAVSALGREKAELEKTISELQLEKDALKEKCTGLQGQMDTFISVEKTLRMELKSKLETISNLQAHSITLEEALSEKLFQIKNLEKEQHEQHLQHNEISAQLADKDVMLAAMSASKFLAAEELQKYSNKQAEIEAQNSCLREQCEKFKAQVDTLEKDKIDLALQLKVSLSKHAITKKEVQFLLEKQTELEKKSSKLNLEVKDLHGRLALGGEEYRRKYIEWHKMQNKVIKLQKKLLSLQTNKQDGPSAETLKHSVDNTAARGSLPDCQDLSTSSGYVQSDMRENRVPLHLMRSASIGANLNEDQSAKIHAAMENQLQKFHGTKGSSNSQTDINVRESVDASEGQSVTSSTSQKSYPYPPFYPYPYPQGLMADSCNNLSNNSGSVPNSFLVSSPPYVERRWLSAANCEDSFIMIPSPNTQVLAQENVQQTNIHTQPLLELRSNMRTAEEETMNSSCYITCPICEEHCPESSDINEHIDTHFYLKCPVCLMLFSRDEYDMESFNKHVLEHLD